MIAPQVVSSLRRALLGKDILVDLDVQTIRFLLVSYPHDYRLSTHRLSQTIAPCIHSACLPADRH